MLAQIKGIIIEYSKTKRKNENKRTKEVKKYIKV